MAVINTKALSTHTRGWLDLDLDFTKHPITKDVNRMKDVAAIRSFFILKLMVEYQNIYFL
jgi:hypothetical protein